MDRFRAGVIAACVVLVLGVTAVSVRLVPDNVRFQVGQVFPEGWELFTKDPQLPIFRTAVFRGGEWKRADRGPLSKSSNWFGFSRNVRWQSVEIERLVQEVPNLSVWTRCKQTPTSCLDGIDDGDVVAVRNRTPFRTLCGRVGLVRQFVLPWDEADPDGNDFRTTHVVALDAECG